MAGCYCWLYCLLKGDMMSKRDAEISSYAEENGYDNAAEHFHITRESVRRACRRERRTGAAMAVSDEALLRKLHLRFSDDELNRMSEGSSINPEQYQHPVLNFSGEEIIIGVVGDTHIGSKYFEDYLWQSFVDECKRQKVKCIMHTGDITEGMSNRPDHVYSLEDIGFSAQMDHAERLLKDTPFDIYGIDGNHDRWGIKSGGLFVGEELDKKVSNYHFLGHDTADMSINGTKWRLWHGEDGSSYATSYRIQKIIEATDVSDLPDVLLCGHVHKWMSLYKNRVCAASTGALSFQTAWMRSKRLDCDTGFLIVKAVISDGKIVSYSPVWYPIDKA